MRPLHWDILPAADATLKARPTLKIGKLILNFCGFVCIMDPYLIIYDPKKGAIFWITKT